MEDVEMTYNRNEIIMVENSGYLVSRNHDSGKLRWWAPEDKAWMSADEEDVRPAHPVEIAVGEAIIGWKDGDPPVGLGTAIKALMEVYQAAYFLRGMRW